MLNLLQKKWKVSGWQLALVFLTFAIGGSLTGYVGRKLLNLFTIEQNWLWIIVYIIIVVLLWPLAVLLVSVFTGQFKFFAGYIRRIGFRIGLGSKPAVRDPGSEDDNQKTGTLLSTPHPTPPFHIAIFASGAGSNAQKIIDQFRESNSTKVALIVCNNPAAGVLKIAAVENIPVLIIQKEKFFRGEAYVKELEEKHIDLVVLAGFLWKLPSALIQAFAGRIINIHPALLPKYGGKGMYGNNVHTAVITAGEKESGITIHYVDEQYDHGDIIFQAKCPVAADDTADSLAQRIHKLEHEYYPKVVGEVAGKLKG